MPEAADEAGYPPISGYAVIGDCHTAALITRSGSIDWYCPARFDAPAVFCRMLDASRGGYLSIAPVTGYTTTRRYRGQTNILETTFNTPDGQVRLTDLMPLTGRELSASGQDVDTSSQILRLVEGLAGEVECELRFKPTFDYARADTQVALAEGGELALASGRATGRLVLACRGMRLAGDRGEARGRWHVRAGERTWITLRLVPAGSEPERGPSPDDLARQVAETERYWQRWANACTYTGPYRAEVLRSALLLKLLTYEPTGAIIAAPTTSLPERIGGVRNWDYRYTWLRDSALLIYALMTIGYQQEAGDFFHWLDRAQKADPSALPQIMYTLDGSRNLPEFTLDNLAGYRNSRPVRVGNAAGSQLQLDIFGELLTAAHLHYRHVDGAVRPGTGPDRATWAALAGLVDQAASRWQEADHSIWEIRDEPQLFLYSRLMCWAALDSGIRLAEDYHLPAPLDRWQATRGQIRTAILTRGYDAGQGTFTQAFGSHVLDASTLIIPRVGFLSPTDPRMRSTIAHIRKGLTQDGLVYRYRAGDGLPGGQGFFVPCSFWLAEALALSGQLEAAHDVFAGASQHANEVGLLAEEIAPDTGALLGNFPQGFSHAALINAAVNLAKAEKHGPEHAPETQADRATRARRAASSARHPDSEKSPARE